MLDTIIVGSGIAGVSAALTLKANGKEFIILGRKDLSSKIEKAEEIRNYPGLFRVKGKEFLSAITLQLESEGIMVLEDRVAGIYKMNNSYIVAVESGKTYEAKTVILCLGVEAIKKIEGEEEFLGRGVSYCATCDGALYKDKTIAVVCSSKRFENEAKYLIKLAKKTYYIPLYKDPEIVGDRVETIVKMPIKIEGGLRVENLVFKDEEIKIDGVFLLKESIPPSSLVGGLQVENGCITTNKLAETNLKGLFAAGDCTGRPYQYAKACGEGNVAAHSAIEYIAEKKL